MAYVSIVCHCEDCSENENRECTYMGELEIMKIKDVEKNEIRAECSVYRDSKKFVDGPPMI